MGEDTQENKKYSSILKYIGITLIGIMFLAIFFITPYLILYIFQALPIDTSLLNEAEYLDSVLQLLTILIEGSIGVIAYNLSRKLGNLELQKDKLTIITAARDLHKNITTNNIIINKIKCNLEKISNINYDDLLAEKWVTLEINVLIDSKDVNLLEEYYTLILNFRTCNDKVANRDDIVDSYINHFLLLGPSNTYVPNREFQALIDKLKKIGKIRKDKSNA